MPGFDREDIEASLRMLEVVDTDGEANLVFNGRSKAVLETLGVCLQNYKPLEEIREIISTGEKSSNYEDDPKPKIKIKQERLQTYEKLIYHEDGGSDLEEIQKHLLDDSTFETSEDEDDNNAEDFNDQLIVNQDISDSEEEGEDLPIKSVEGKEDFEDKFDLDDISDEEEEDQNANKSFELSDDDASTMMSTDSLSKPSYQESKMKEVKTLVKKSNKVWSCKSCDYSNICCISRVDTPRDESKVMHFICNSLSKIMI